MRGGCLGRREQAKVGGVQDVSQAAKAVPRECVCSGLGIARAARAAIPFGTVRAVGARRVAVAVVEKEGMSCVIWADGH